MKKTDLNRSRIIRLEKGIIGPILPRSRSLQQKRIGDYPAVPKVYLEIAANFASIIYGNPPLCDELVNIVQHMFTEEEASLVRHIKPLQKKTAAAIAKAEHRPEEEVKRILEDLANEKHVLMSSGPDLKKRYNIMPFAGGTFELVQMGEKVETPEDKNYSWRRRFAVLYEELYKTGYMTDFAISQPHFIRTLPIGKSIAYNHAALPSDKLEEVLDRYNSFAVGNCGCRMTKKQIGEDCGRPLEVCTGMGGYVETAINKGIMRRVEKKEIIEIKKEAEAKGLIHWVANVDEKSGRFGNLSCSCCGCCCAVFRLITEFNVPGMIAPPHFIPDFDSAKCDYCGQCAKRCQLGAITVDIKNKTLSFNTHRCIGCGQCLLACEKQQAIQMNTAENYKKPAESLPAMALRLLPNYLRMFWNVWKERRF